MIGREFAHVHPPHDGSMHLMLPLEVARELTGKGGANCIPWPRPVTSRPMP
jgi:hypothetical protein